MSDPRQIYEKLTNSFWLPTKQPPREQLAFSAAWDYQQLIIDRLHKENAELKEELQSAESAVSDLMEVNDQLRAEYTAYRETAVVEADLLRKENAELEAQILYWKVKCNAKRSKP